ncbi:umuC protein [Deltaproteobacteria bacterium]|nr:umuC protein [Deltaproteobacteria bacterium]
MLSNNDGCIVSRSNEAKALGIGMGVPAFTVRALLAQHNVTVFSSNYTLYGDISARVMRALEHLVPVIDQYSIDEAFIPLSGSLAVNADEIARAMRETVHKWTGITVSVGVGTTKTLAKLAGEIAKKENGLCRLDAESEETERLLAQTPVGDVWGIGKRLTDKLRLRSIRSAKDLRDAPEGMIRKLLSVTGLHTALELRGIARMNPSETPTPRRTLVSSRSFGQRVTEKEYLAEALAMHASHAGERLRKEKLETCGLAVHIRTARYGEGPFYDETVEVTLPLPTANTRDLIRATRDGLETAFRPGYSYAKAGIMLFDLAPRASGQGNFMELLVPEEKKRRDKKLMMALDGANRKFGRGALRFAAEGAPDAPWQAQHNRRSPRWTTAWDELPKAGA